MTLKTHTQLFKLNSILRGFFFLSFTLLKYFISFFPHLSLQVFEQFADVGAMVQQTKAYSVRGGISTHQN